MCSLKVARDAGEFKSQSLMESSQLPVRKVFLLTTFQFTQYTCVVPCMGLPNIQPALDGDACSALPIAFQRMYFSSPYCALVIWCPILDDITMLMAQVLLVRLCMMSCTSSALEDGHPTLAL